MTLDKMLAELEFSMEAEAAVRWKIKKDEREIGKIAETAYCGEDFNFELLRRKPLTRLSVVVWLLVKKYDAYRAINVSDEIIFDTFRDVVLLSDLYYRRTGNIGIAKKDVIWLRHIMNVNIFKIGSLQYQPFEMVYLDKEGIGEDYMSFSPEQKKALPTGAPVINCHIQRGADLRPEAVDASMHRARDFFRSRFPDRDFRAFLCYSWLLYPEMTEALDEHSKIRRFANRFEIVGQIADSESAFENMFEDGKRRAMSNYTGLQKMALDHPERVGFACGIRWM